ncbi:MAG: Gfo/Idh/MocA family oxidoreductase [Verrucomicrobiae bacterium]|nr:Gfo/Idh/MocA family oxidoreductase [Verrucomicrobiae bacterium]
MKIRGLSRRQFLRRAGQATSGIAVGLALPNVFLNRTRAATGENPSEWVRVGFIGVGAQGLSNLNALMKHAVAVCDVDRNRLAAAAERVQKARGGECKTFTDYRKLLEDPSIDAVCISTPDHWHALQTIHACQAGKDVYCEKPLTLTIREGQVVVAIAQRTGRIVQTGSQQRSDARFRRACELLRSGYLGRIGSVEVGLPGPNYAERARPLRVPDSAPPPELDYDMWLGPAPWRPYNANRVHYLFRFFWDYSGGQMTNWGAHHLDIVQWALDMDAGGPCRAEGYATYHPDGLFETPLTFEASYEYPGGVRVTVHSPHPGGLSGCRFVCEKGVLRVGRGVLETEPEELLANAPAELPVRLYESKQHHQNWIECIKTRRAPICDAHVGHRSVTVCHLGNIAVRSGRVVRWDARAERIVGDAKLAAWLDKPYRPPWKLPEV